LNDSCEDHVKKPIEIREKAIRERRRRRGIREDFHAVVMIRREGRRRKINVDRFRSAAAVTVNARASVPTIDFAQ
jgi:hypothetical protein